jgi:hypothetical protein
LGTNLRTSSGFRVPIHPSTTKVTIIRAPTHNVAIIKKRKNVIAGVRATELEDGISIAVETD